MDIIWEVQAFLDSRIKILLIRSRTQDRSWGHGFCRTDKCWSVVSLLSDYQSIRAHLMPWWTIELRLVLHTMRSAHCTTTMDTKKAVWHVYSTCFLALYVCIWPRMVTIGRRDTIYYIPIPVRMSPSSRWHPWSPNPSWGRTDPVTWIRIRPWWRSMHRSRQQPGSFRSGRTTPIWAVRSPVCLSVGFGAGVSLYHFRPIERHRIRGRS